MLDIRMLNSLDRNSINSCTLHLMSAFEFYALITHAILTDNGRKPRIHYAFHVQRCKSRAADTKKYFSQCSVWLVPLFIRDMQQQAMAGPLHKKMQTPCSKHDSDMCFTLLGICG